MTQHHTGLKKIVGKRIAEEDSIEIEEMDSRGFRGMRIVVNRFTGFELKTVAQNKRRNC